VGDTPATLNGKVPGCLTEGGRIPEIRRVNIQDIKRRITGGFVPFTIRTSDGEKFPVPHKEFIYVTDKRVVVSSREGYIAVLDPLHIVCIEEERELPTR
jgi:hypothetical protein